MSRSSFSFKDIELQLEKDKKAIPSKVFFNHFYAIYFHLKSTQNKFQLKSLDYYNKLKINNPNFNLDLCRKLIWNSWSTEYAFNISSKVQNADFYRYAMHWHFPQAYYSIYLAMTAFHETQGVANDQHEKSIKLFGNSIKDGHYPEAISFYSKGLFNEFEYLGLEKFKGFPKDFNALSKISTLDDAHLQIANFLKSTREKNAENKRNRSNQSYSKDKRFLTSKGIFTQKFSKKHWNIIYSSIPETTILNIMYRLRIKANYHDIETFINAEIDFVAFHKSLGSIIFYLNFIHEAYLHKVIGDDNYQKILNEFNGHILDDKAQYRYREIISKL
jgi:hypothetical protein